MNMIILAMLFLNILCLLVLNKVFSSYEAFEPACGQLYKFRVNSEHIRVWLDILSLLLLVDRDWETKDIQK